MNHENNFKVPERTRKSSEVIIMDSPTQSQPIDQFHNFATGLADAGVAGDIVYQDFSEAAISDIFLYIQSKTFVSIYIYHHLSSY